jgi:DNA-binding NarL/FixJ family response regulator
VNLRVAIFEDDPGYREGLAALLRFAPGFELVGVHGAAAATVRAAEQAAERGEPRPWDLVLSDIEMPGMSGIEACRRLKEAYPGLPVIVLTVFEEPATILDAIRAGADGYLLKRSTAPELLAGLRAIAGGGAPLTAAVARSVLELLRQGDDGPVSGPPSPAAPQRLELGEREQEVLRGLVRGGTYARIADEMGISLDTVRGHIRSIYRKLQVNSAKAAVSRAVRERLV